MHTSQRHQLFYSTVDGVNSLCKCTSAKKNAPPWDGNRVGALKQGTIDAMFYVAGFPVKLFSEHVSAVDGQHLVPITNKSVIEFYPMAEIPGNTYAWQAETIQTVAVKAVLISFDFRRNNCDYVGEVTEIVLSTF